MLARIRKALIAGGGAGLAAGFGAIATSGALTRDEVSKAIGVGVAAAVSVGWATWRVPNHRPFTPGETASTRATRIVAETGIPRNYQV